MPVITLTTDWGDTDYYKGAAKGVILSHVPTAIIVDISHHITPFDYIHAARVLKYAYPFYPQGSIHIIGVDSEYEKEKPFCIIRYQSHYFIGKDNGIFSLMFEQTPDKIIHIEHPDNMDKMTFLSRSIFCRIGAEMLNGKKMEEFGREAKEIKKVSTYNPVISENEIIGMVMYVDHYHNLVTNISQTTFENHRKNRKFSILLHHKMFEINKININYHAKSEADIIALFGENGFLEIALYKGKANQLLGMQENASVIIRFYNDLK